ncbi:MAG TPA: LptF/LptG family permease, partial [Fimbriimonadaceae bacterium]|nr:LptF/LptG family permease [Fimbriimonadaceae bacterium]
MRVVDRYVFKELMVPFLIGTVAVVLMFQANFLIYILKTFSLGNIPPLALAQIILLKTPSFLNLTLPVGMALAASLAMSRL